MEIIKKKCSSKGDEKIDAIIYCGECKIYICNKCEKFHTKLFDNHITYNIENQIGELFTDFCQEKNHRQKLQFFCKNHNILCCVACISKIAKNEFGKHKDCEICLIEDIKEGKKEQLISNIKYLEEISNTFEESINTLKESFGKIIENKEQLKLNIQKIFTKIRNELNNREDELMLEVDKKFDELYFDEKIFKDKDKIINKIKLILEKSKKIEDENLILFINDCINIEKNIKEINQYNEKINKFKKSSKIDIQFKYESEEKLNLFMEKIKNFGKICGSSYFDSSILNDDDINKKEQIINWIKEKTNKNQIEFEKIFDMNINGNLSKDFHNYCNNKGPTLTIIKTTKNKIFGGFTPLNWDNNGRNKVDKDNQTFLFSLDLLKKYDLIDKNKTAIYCCKGYGPYFGGRDFSIEKNMKKGETYSNRDTNFINNNNLDLTGGKGNNEYFEIDNFEVFKVLY